MPGGSANTQPETFPRCVLTPVLQAARSRARRPFPAAAAGFPGPRLTHLRSANASSPCRRAAAQAACHRLAASRMSIAEIALETGFAHQGHMTRSMRRLIGLTPGEFARARQSCPTDRVGEPAQVDRCGHARSSDDRHAAADTGRQPGGAVNAG
ncbi:helix-turn-helix domain-containing protein [Phenylobacterium sp.]|uniref:helix-turn-helix domain-containing protein n=1 Tax=Phenylobacterium sp. TaxID=1871053 RepID=UPI003451B9F4